MPQQETTALNRVKQNVLVMARVFALVVMLIYFPALVGLWALIVLTSPGPALVKKAYRRGSGEVVYLYEFRTECWRTWRPTTLGKFMLLADLHRLPRLMNVLTGEVNVGERIQAVQV
jgi:lipopolysaccharide/colanic/teichoic acid biosynthesis glycosyltransferase